MYRLVAGCDTTKPHFCLWQSVSMRSGRRNVAQSLWILWGSKCWTVVASRSVARVAFQKSWQVECVQNNNHIFLGLCFLLISSTKWEWSIDWFQLGGASQSVFRGLSHRGVRQQTGIIYTSSEGFGKSLAHTCNVNRVALHKISKI